MKLVQKKSPNHGARPAGVAVDCIVLHATADADTQASVTWCCSPTSKVSYHVIVDRDGTVFALVDTARRAWHAGVSSFKGREDVNDFSIGLSFANRNDGKEPYPPEQLDAAAAICAAWMARYPAITLDRITTHREIAPSRKTDPAPPAFDLIAFRTRVAAEIAAPRTA